ncbi:MAG TPA: MCP four helix bundle domain-containing protein, partial [Burkholderiaceae bacterium]
MNFLKNLKIGLRLALAFGTVLVLMLVVAAVGLMGIGKVSTSLKSVYEDRTVPLAQLSEIQYNFVRNRVLVMDMLGRPEPANIERRSTELEANLARSSEILKAYLATEMTTEEQRLIDEYQKLRSDFNQRGLLALAAAVSAGKVDEAQKIYLEVISPNSPAVEKTLRGLVDVQINQGKVEYDNANATSESVRLTTIVASIIALAIGAALAWAIAASITR